MENESWDRGDRVARLFRSLGNLRPAVADEQRARQILAAAPTGEDILAIATYFEGLAEVATSGYRFNEDWPRHQAYNPLIFEFFRATSPDHWEESIGDATHWCAAFVNWCLGRSGRQGTGHAGTRSFRRYVQDAKLANPGDVVVFADVDAQGRLLSSGHVGLFVRQGPDTVTVLGGNQVPEKPERLENSRRRDCVCTADLPKERRDAQNVVNRRLLGTCPLSAFGALPPASP